jgi:uncharacterized protein
VNELINIARESIKAELENEEFEIDENLKEKYSEERSCFVTLKLDGKLRGCMGSLLAYRPLWEDIIENAKACAFDDYRFSSLTMGEFEDVKIEISLLSVPKKLEYENWKDLLDKLEGNEGLILKKGKMIATYLPQVWEEIKSKEEFLSSLCEKAGLVKDEWKREVEIETYYVEIIKE